MLAREIARDMMSLTVHDETHLDALWEIAGDIAGEDVELNPLEAFVFGAAVLVHDLGLGVAAYPGGVAELRSGEAWRDALAVALRGRLGRFPKAEELVSPEPEEQDLALQILLRRRHATQAEKLGLVRWIADDGEEHHLLGAQDLRRAYGALIGEIAGSHWRELEDLRAQLDRTVNPPAGYPAHWTIDVLKLACLLRVADAVHIDARRAPTFLRVLRRPTGVSRLHWLFQGRLLRPVVVHDRIRFNSGEDFSRADARAWWVGFDLIRSADRELREVDDLLADLGRQRFRARGVMGADDPERLARFVRTQGWTPVDASLRVSDVKGLIERLGGAALYGNDPSVPLRELIQNATDAVLARRALQGRPVDWGEITVTIGSEPDGAAFVEVADTGVGMSVQTLTTTLLDFGSSLWHSPDLVDVHPGLAATGYEATGRFGIGFFSVLMWGDRVQVTSRRMQDGIGATRVLELVEGVQSRPLLRSATEQERLIDGGTAVKVRLQERESQALESDEVWSALSGRSSLDTVVSVVQWLAPTLAVNVGVRAGDRHEAVVGGADWSTIPGEQLLARCYAHGAGTKRVRGLTYSPRRDKAVAGRLRVIHNRSGEPVARICVHSHGFAVVTVGGFRADQVYRMAGVVLGDAPNLARNRATPMVEAEAFKEWLTEQGELVAAEDPMPWHVNLALTLLEYDCPIGDLPICLDGEGMPVKRDRVAQYASQHDEVWITSDFDPVSWLFEGGYAAEGISEIDFTEDFFDLSRASLGFVAFGMPAPPANVAADIEGILRDVVAREWGVPSLETQRGDLVVGVFRGEEIEIPADAYVRPSPDDRTKSE
jgi:hypothetical protein